jgi:hypothetical protein
LQVLIWLAGLLVPTRDIPYFQILPLGYATARGRTLIDRRLYLPTSWTDDRERCRRAGIDDDVAGSAWADLGGDPTRSSRTRLTAPAASTPTCENAALRTPSPRRPTSDGTGSGAVAAAADRQDSTGRLTGGAT